MSRNKKLDKVPWKSQLSAWTAELKRLEKESEWKKMSPARAEFHADLVSNARKRVEYFRKKVAQVEGGPKGNPHNKTLVQKAQYALKMGTLKDAGGASRAEIEAAFKRAEAKAQKKKAPKKRARPDRFSVRCHSYQGGYLMFEGSLTRAEADKVYASCKREGYSPVIFDGRKKIK